MYNRLDNSGAGTWNAQSLLAEGDEMQNEFPEELWRLDIERKYIRTYTKSFINGGPWKAGLTQMCNGRMKYHRRQWERNQEQYISSKFITDSIFNDSTAVSLRGPAQTLTGDAYAAVPPKYEFTLTPRLYTYLNVRYGTTNGEIITKRAEPGKAEKMTYNGTYNDLLYVGNGDSISDLGDLSSFYLEKVSLGNAPKLRGLKLGNNTVGYKNTHFEEWSSGNPLLETLNIENVEWKGSANKTLNLDDMLSLQTIKAFGSNITGVVFAKGSKLNYAELPKTLTTLALKKLPYLTTENIKIENNNYDSILDLIVEGCPNVDAIELLNSCTKLNRARLIDVVLEDVTYDYFYNTFIHRLLPDGSYGPLKGISASDEQTDNAVITGVAKFKSLTGTQYNELRTRYPNLDIRYESLTCVVQFKLNAESEVIHTQTLISYNNKFVDCVDPVSYGQIATPLKEQTDSHTYSYAGWSEKSDGIPVDPSPLIEVSNDLVLYPTFDEHIRKYVVTFYNNDNTKLNSYDVDYGTDHFEYPEEDPKKAGVTNPDNYQFNEWVPKPENILGNLDCYATYELKASSIHEVTHDDIEYEIDGDELTILKYLNTSNKIIRIPEAYTISGNQYKVVNIGYPNSVNTGFSNMDLEYVILPNGLKNIAADSFSNNKTLTTINIPESVESIGSNAFSNCSALTDVYYDAKNAKIHKISESDYYVFNNTYSYVGYDVHIGKNVQLIPSYMFAQSSENVNMRAARSVSFEKGSCCTSIESYAFIKAKCLEVTFPESLLTIKTNAFEYSDIEELILPSSLTSIEQDAFSHCEELKEVYVPKSVRSISSAAFRYSWNFEFEIESGSIFVWKNHCLVNTSTKALLMGRKNSVIPSDMGIKTISQHCFTEVEIESIVVPEGVSSISQYGFYNCRNLVNLTLPTSLTIIESFGIYGCAFTSLVLPINLQSLGTYALFNNFNLKQITFPASVKSIGYDTLGDCTSLEKVVFETTELTVTKPNNTSNDLFTKDTMLSSIEVAWRSDAEKFAKLNADAPWKAGTNSDGNRVIDVTVKYTNEEKTYLKEV